MTLKERFGPKILTMFEKGTSFASRACTFESSRLVVRLKYAPN